MSLYDYEYVDGETACVCRRNLCNSASDMTHSQKHSGIMFQN